jgi:hypothetical protein
MDTTWAEIRIWPFPSATDLEISPRWEALREAFEAVGLAHYLITRNDLGGVRIEDDPRRGRVLVAEQEESDYGLEEWREIFPLLRSFDLAYHALDGGSWDYDGSEEAWHPGMDEPFSAKRLNRGGRVLHKSDLACLQKRLATDDPAAIGSAVQLFF